VGLIFRERPIHEGIFKLVRERTPPSVVEMLKVFEQKKKEAVES